jgi:hypothetical protein
VDVVSGVFLRLEGESEVIYLAYRSPMRNMWNMSKMTPVPSGSLEENLQVSSFLIVRFFSPD